MKEGPKVVWQKRKSTHFSTWGTNTISTLTQVTTTRKEKVCGVTDSSLCQEAGSFKTRLNCLFYYIPDNSNQTQDLVLNDPDSWQRELSVTPHAFSFRVGVTCVSVDIVFVPQVEKLVLLRFCHSTIGPSFTAYLLIYSSFILYIAIICLKSWWVSKSFFCPPWLRCTLSNMV